MLSVCSSRRRKHVIQRQTFDFIQSKPRIWLWMKSFCIFCCYLVHFFLKEKKKSKTASTIWMNFLFRRSFSHSSYVSFREILLHDKCYLLLITIISYFLLLKCVCVFMFNEVINELRRWRKTKLKSLPRLYARLWSLCALSFFRCLRNAIFCTISMVKSILVRFSIAIWDDGGKNGPKWFLPWFPFEWIKMMATHKQMIFTFPSFFLLWTHIP